MEKELFISLWKTTNLDDSLIKSNAIFIINESFTLDYKELELFNSDFKTSENFPNILDERTFSTYFVEENSKVNEEEIEKPVDSYNKDQNSVKDKKRKKLIQKGTKKKIKKSIIGKNKTNVIDRNFGRIFSINFLKLKNVLLKVFKQEKFEIEELDFQISELRILKKIFEIKFHKIYFFENTVSSNENLLRENLYKKIQNFDDIDGSTKRNEENKKFIFKLVYKNLKKKFFESSSFSGKKKEMKFLNFYFKSIIVDNLHEEKIFRELYNNSKKTSLNLGYLKFIFSSELFKKDFFNFLENDFLLISLNSMDHKITQFLMKLNSLIKKDSKNEVAIEKSILNYLENGKGIKFSWTKMEIEEAIKTFTIYINNIINI